MIHLDKVFKECGLFSVLVSALETSLLFVFPFTAPRLFIKASNISAVLQTGDALG